MTRHEFIQRAAVAMVTDPNVTHHGRVAEQAAQLADEVAKVAPFDDKVETADAIDSLYQKLDSIQLFLEKRLGRL
jgi:hypothetical protein